MSLPPPELLPEPYVHFLVAFHKCGAYCNSLFHCDWMFIPMAAIKGPDWIRPVTVIVKERWKHLEVFNYRHLETITAAPARYFDARRPGLKPFFIFWTKPEIQPDVLEQP